MASWIPLIMTLDTSKLPRYLVKTQSPMVAPPKLHKILWRNRERRIFQGALGKPGLLKQLQILRLANCPPQKGWSLGTLDKDFWVKIQGFSPSLGLYFNSLDPKTAFISCTLFWLDLCRSYCRSQCGQYLQFHHFQNSLIRGVSAWGLLCLVWST